MTQLTQNDLDAYVACVDRNGGDWNAPEVRRIIDDFSYAYATPVDKDADPFSPAYYDSQIRLYEEISGRQLQQSEGEQAPVPVGALVPSANPMGIDQVTHLAENVRALSALLKACDLPPAAKVLDLGCGAGVSTETYAFCGARVTAVDINPLHVELVLARAAQRHYPVTAHALGFDDLGTLGQSDHDAALFFQSFHHAVRPWDLIAALEPLLKPSGVIGFTGEPVQSNWWPNWGLRLDHESVYVARKYGWFENGWSRSFITDCFARQGWNLDVIPGEGHGEGVIGVARRAGPGTTQASAQTLVPLTKGLRCLSVIGRRALVAGQPGHVADGTTAGHLSFGPYLALPAGRYTAYFLARVDIPGREHPIEIDVASSHGHTVHAWRTVRLPADGSASLVELSFTLPRNTEGIEARVRLPEPAPVACADPWFGLGRA